MRTTLTIDDEVAELLAREAKRRRESFKTVVNEALRLGLERLRPTARKVPFRQRTFKMGYPPAGNLDKALRLASLLEDEETIRKSGLGR